MRKYIKMFEDLIPGGLGDNKPDSDFDERELKMGQKEETEEHTNNPQIGKEIAKDHLTKNPKYYSNNSANEDVADSIAGGYADTMKQSLDTKNASLQHNDEDVLEDTTNPDNSNTIDPYGRDLRSNDDLSNFVINTTNESINQPDYEFYLCEILGDRIIINEGFEYKEDAFERRKEQKAEGHDAGLTFKVFTKRFLISKGFNPDDDVNWGNPSFMNMPSDTTNEAQSAKLKHKMKKVMGEFKRGTLKSGSGKKVTDPKQAVAIGYSEAGESKKTNENSKEPSEEMLKYNSYSRKLKDDDFIGDKSKPLFKSDSQIHKEREKSAKEREYEKYRDAKDISWKERRRLQSEKDKAKNAGIMKFEDFTNEAKLSEQYNDKVKELEKSKQNAVKNVVAKSSNRAGAQKKANAMRTKIRKEATKA